MNIKTAATAQIIGSYGIFSNFMVVCLSAFLDFAVLKNRESPPQGFFSAGRKQRLDITVHLT